MSGLFRTFVAISLVVCQLSFSYAQGEVVAEQVKPTDKETSLNEIIVLLKGASNDRTGLDKQNTETLIADIEAIRELSAIENPTDQQKTQLSELIKKVTPALGSIAKAYKGSALAITEGSIEGFTQKELDRIREICGGTFDDMLAAVQTADQGVSLAADLGDKANQCRLLIVDAQAAIAKQLSQLDETHQALLEEQRRLEQKYADAKTPEEKEQARAELNENEAKIKEVEEKKKQVQEVKGEVDWFAAIAGLALVVVGVVVAIYGDPATGMELVIAGGTMAQAATSPKTEKKEVEVPSVRAEREGLEAEKKPNPADAESLVNEFKSKGLEPISGSSEGNYVVFLDPADKSWIIMQIDPRLIVLRIAPSKVTIQSNGPALASMGDLAGPKVISLSVVGNVNVNFNAKLADGQEVSGGIAEQGVGSHSYLLTLNTGFLPQP